jgi:hypothetical protein
MGCGGSNFYYFSHSFAGLSRRRRRRIRARHSRRQAVAGAAQSLQKKKQKRKQSGMHPGTFLQLQKIQEPHCKPSFPTILEFK